MKHFVTLEFTVAFTEIMPVRH